MQFTFQRPERHGPDSDLVAAGPVGEVAQAAVRAGFHGFSLTEHPAPAHGGWPPAGINRWTRSSRSVRWPL
jgi:hypothetical protein